MGSFFKNPKVCPMPMLRLTLGTNPGRSKSDPGMRNRSVEVPADGAVSGASGGPPCAEPAFALERIRTKTKRPLQTNDFIIAVPTLGELSHGQNSTLECAAISKLYESIP